MATTYSIHSAYDHSIVATASGVTLRRIAQEVAQEWTRDSDATLRFYVHNGKGVVAAMMARNGTAHDTLRDDYMRFAAKAAAKRAAAGLHID